MRTKIKICGITNPKNAIEAAKLGVDALGFVFFSESPRYIEPKKAREIIDLMPSFISRVGLFVNASKKEVLLAISESRINMLQFHGDEDENFCNQFDLPYIKAISLKDGINLLEYCQAFSSSSAILIDTYSQEVRGGTGKTFNWDLIPKNLPSPLIIAGGLHSDNVSSLIHSVNPYGVDVSGGVELVKGIKDHKMMKNFVLGVNNATI
ncbi:phosphoribosylanthranilate isomerase [Methylophilaceae bacterium]|nr:phosphoribosylanthranilate isomerase [Methylophilaceae bacterium]